MEDLVNEVNEALGPESRWESKVDLWGDVWGGEEAFKIDTK